MLLLACAGKPGSVGGQAVDGRTGQPVSNLEVAWVSDGEGSCARLATQTDAQGAYHLDGICPGLSYRLVLGDPDWWTSESSVKAEEKGSKRDLEVWRVPSVGGVYTLMGTTLIALGTHAAVDRLTLMDKSEEVRFPLEIPGVLPRIQGDTLLVLAGEATQNLSFEPLLPGPETRLGSRETPQLMGPWFYLGVRFKGPAEVEAAVAQPDPAHLKTRGSGTQIARFLDGEALPAGRYALGKPDPKRVYLLDFGAAP